MATFLPRSIILRRDAATKKTIKDRRRVADPLFSFEQKMTRASELAAEVRARERELTAKLNPPRFDPFKESYPPEWKPIKESPEFRYGWLKIFVDWDQEQNCDCFPSDPDTYTVHRHDVNPFLQHILETRGYDVDCAVPECMPKPFPAQDFRSVERENPQRYRIYKEIAQAAFTEINIHAEMNGESYAFNGLEKAALGVQSHGVLLMTFTVKQLSPTVGVVKTVQAMAFARGDRYLIGWRFKPEASAADCST